MWIYCLTQLIRVNDFLSPITKVKLAGTSVKIDVFGHKDNTMPYVEEEEEGVDCDYLIKVGISFGCLGFHSSCSSEKRETTASHTHIYSHDRRLDGRRVNVPSSFTHGSGR